MCVFGITSVLNFDILKNEIMQDLDFGDVPVRRSPLRCVATGNTAYCILSLSCISFPYRFFYLLFSFSATVAIITVGPLPSSSDYPVKATVVAAGNIKHMTSCGDFSQERPT